jgi:hypothetical protein
MNIKKSTDPILHTAQCSTKEKLIKGKFIKVRHIKDKNIPFLQTHFSVLIFH